MTRRDRHHRGSLSSCRKPPKVDDVFSRAFLPAKAERMLPALSN